MEKFKFEELKLMNLHDLRLIGAKIGVRAPTNKTKIELIKAIIDVSTGVTNPYKTNVGRPRSLKPKLDDDKDLIEKVTKVIAEQKSQRELYEKAVDKMLGNLRTYLLMEYDK